MCGPSSPPPGHWPTALRSAPVAATYPELFNRAFVVQRWVIEQRTARDIADTLGCDPKLVTLAVARFGLQRGKRGRHRPPQPALQSKRKLAALYAEHGSMMNVAEHLHCDQDDVREAMDPLGIPRRAYVKHSDRQWFVDALARGLTVGAMAAELGCHPFSVYRSLERFGLPRPGTTVATGGTDVP